MFLRKSKLILLVISLLMSRVSTLQGVFTIQQGLNSMVTTGAMGLINKSVSKLLAYEIVERCDGYLTALYNTTIVDDEEKKVLEKAHEKLSNDTAREKYIRDLMTALAKVNMGIILWITAEKLYGQFHTKLVPHNYPCNIRYIATPDQIKLFDLAYKSGMDILSFFEFVVRTKHMYDKRYLASRDSLMAILAEEDAWYKGVVWTTSLLVGFVANFVGFNFVGGKSSRLVGEKVGNGSFWKQYVKQSTLFTLGILVNRGVSQGFFTWADGTFENFRDCGDTCKELFWRGTEIAYCLLGVMPRLYKRSIFV